VRRIEDSTRRREEVEKVSTPVTSLAGKKDQKQKRKKLPPALPLGKPF